MRNFGKPLRRGRADKIARTVRSFQCGKTPFDREIAAFQRIIFRIGNPRGIICVIGRVRLVQTLRKLRQFDHGGSLGQCLDIAGFRMILHSRTSPC